MNEPYVNKLGRKHQFLRLTFSFCWALLVSWIPRSMLPGWKRFILRCFGAKLSSTAHIYSSAKIYYPPNLIMDDYACLASDVDCYNVAPIKLGKFVTVSQGTLLCAGSHDIESPGHEMITAPITIRDNAWIGVKAFIGMGVEIGEGAVVGATASVYKNIEPWTVVGGNPAKFLKKRVLKDA